MKKFLTIFTVLFLILGIFVSRVQASSVNMNLSNTDNSTYGSTYTNTSSNNSTNTNNEASNLTSNNTYTPNSSVNVSTTTSTDGLTTSDMINIFVCVIGIIMILLGIAILIRLH